MTIKTRFGTYHNGYFRVGRYLADNSLCIDVWDHLEGPLAKLTVCLEDRELAADESYVDVNNFPEALGFIADHNLGTPTGKTRQSGYVTYPVVKFDKAAFSHDYVALPDFSWEGWED